MKFWVSCQLAPVQKRRPCRPCTRAAHHRGSWLLLCARNPLDCLSDGGRCARVIERVDSCVARQYDQKFRAWKGGGLKPRGLGDPGGCWGAARSWNSSRAARRGPTSTNVVLAPTVSVLEPVTGAPAPSESSHCSCPVSVAVNGRDTST